MLIDTWLQPPRRADHVQPIGMRYDFYARAHVYTFSCHRQPKAG